MENENNQEVNKAALTMTRRAWLVETKDIRRFAFASNPLGAADRLHSTPLYNLRLSVAVVDEEGKTTIFPTRTLLTRWHVEARHPPGV